MRIISKLYCVYCHTNKLNGKKYIGLTCQKPKDRWDSGHGYRNNKYFWSSIKKHGWINFSHEILFDNLSKEEAMLKEIELIKTNNTTNRKFGYNITFGGESGNGVVLSKEARLKISNANKGHIVTQETRDKISKAHMGKIGLRGEESPLYGRKASEEAKLNMSIAQSGERHRLYGKHRSETTRLKIGLGKSISVVQLDFNGNLIKRWRNLSMTSVDGFLDSKISNCCNGKRLTHGGFIWMYSKEYDNTKISDIIKKCKTILTYVEKYKSKEVIQLNMDGEVIKVWKSICSTVEYGFNKGCVSNCCVGNAKTHQGYRWIYSKDYND